MTQQPEAHDPSIERAKDAYAQEVGVTTEAQTAAAPEPPAPVANPVEDVDTGIVPEDPLNTDE